MPAVSVIVPNYNHARFLRQRLESIYAQTYRDFELIILDDCSTDNSIEVINDIIKDHEADNIPTRFVINETNSGSPFKQWKKGLELAHGEYIWLAESDDYADKSSLEHLIRQCLNHSLTLCFCQSFSTDDNNNINGLYRTDKFYLNDQIFDFNSSKPMMTEFSFVPNASAVMFKREIGLENIDLAIPYRQSGDWIFWYFLIKKGVKCGYISVPLNYFRRHDNATCFQCEKEMINILEAFKIQQQFKSNGIPYNTTFWIKQWLKQTDYSMINLFKYNFNRIIKELIRLDIFGPILLFKFYLAIKSRNLFIKTNNLLKKQ